MLFAVYTRRRQDRIPRHDSRTDGRLKRLLRFVFNMIPCFVEQKRRWFAPRSEPVGLTGIEFGA
jgi:hypothetical protein